MYKNSRKVSSEAGFTLIELLVVIVIIGILGGVLIGIIKPKTVEDRSKDGVRIANVEKLATVIDSIHVLDGSYPVDEDALRSSSLLTFWPENSPTRDDVYSYLYDSDVDGYRLCVLDSKGNYIIYSSVFDQIMRCTTCSFVKEGCVPVYLADSAPADPSEDPIPPEDPPEDPTPPEDPPEDPTPPEDPPEDPPAEPEVTNVALNKPVIAFLGRINYGTYMSVPDSAIVDGNTSSGCVTGTNSTTSSQRGRAVVDLGGEHILVGGAFRYTWDTRFPACTFRALYSNNPTVSIDSTTDWTLLHSYYSSSSGVWVEYALTEPVQARYIKVEYVASSSWSGWGSIWEVAAYGYPIE